jgi:pimeloyl-ACP methyl ester carboxylesterase
MLLALGIADRRAAAQQLPCVPSTARMVDVAGHAVRVQSFGLEPRKGGRPVVVFEGGTGNSLDVWGCILGQIAAHAPVVAYDRAGLGRSAWDGQPPTPQHVATRLRSLLRQIGAEPPYVLVGYSWGGILARYFAGYHPNEVAALVFVDPGPIVTQTRTQQLAPFDSVGAGKAGYDAFWSGYATLVARATPAVRAEVDAQRGLMDRELADRDIRPLPNVPVAVIVAGKYLDVPMKVPYDARAHFAVDVRHRVRLLQEWTLASPFGTLVMSNHSTHALPREDPALLVWAIERVLTAVPKRN